MTQMHLKIKAIFTNKLRKNDYHPVIMHMSQGMIYQIDQWGSEIMLKTSISQHQK